MKLYNSLTRRFPYCRSWMLGMGLLLPGLSLAQTFSTAFGPYRSYPTGSWPEAVAIGDLNGDGRNDVVLTTSFYFSTNDHSILVFYQNPGGTFGNPVHYDAAEDVVSVVIGDFNSDGLNDIGVARETAGLRVYWQGFYGGFDQFTDYAAYPARVLCTADFNHDGRADIAIGAGGLDHVNVLTQQPNGTLALYGGFPVGLTAWQDLDTGDLNHDGLSDIVASDTAGVSVLLQTNGGFAPMTRYATPAKGIGIGDLTGDGLPDIAVAYGGNRPNSKMGLLLQQANGSFVAGTPFNSYDIPEPVAVADIDMNGLPDILTLHGGWERLGVYFQTAPGVFAAETLFVIPYASSYNLHGLAVGDVNGDRSPDVVIADYNHGIVVLTNAFKAPPLPIRQLTAMSRSNGVPRFTLNGPEGRTYVILQSSNLVDWAPLMTNTVPVGGSIPLLDLAAGSDARRYYRAVPYAGANDFFSNRVAIASSGGTYFASNVGATKEPGEIFHAGAFGGKSIWWSWTAPANGLVSITTDGSSFDTTLGVYQATNVAALTVIASDDDSGEGLRSRVLFNATAGTSYAIAVDGYLGETGDIVLTVKPGLLNDAFANRLRITGSSDLVVGSNAGATKETGEPFHWGSTGGASVWWTWQAPATAPVSFTTVGSSFNTIMAAYTGTALTGLSLVAQNDDFGTNKFSQITFNATQGTVYQIAVDGAAATTGAIQLVVQQ